LKATQQEMVNGMASWADIVSEHSPGVWRTAYRLLNNRADADECMQEAFVTAVWLSRRKEIRSWGGLLHRLVTARALDRLRSRIRESARQEEVADWAMIPSGDPPPDRAACNGELVDRLRACLARLPARGAEAFCLRFLNEMSYEDIAQQLHVSVNHVGVILNRARERLRELWTVVAATEGSEGADHD
jgi:RNA polymerase sigma-70 factor (ECF subfamily)